MTGSPEHVGSSLINIQIQINHQPASGQVEPRLHLADFLRQCAGLKGTRLGCEQGHCGACTVDINGQAVRACLTLAVQADGECVQTIEGMSEDPVGQVLQDAFITHHAMQCGYCTAGMIMSARALLMHTHQPTREQVREGLSGNYCRCTGYEAIVNAVMAAAASLQGTSQGGAVDV